MAPRALFRADAGPSLGGGHVMRCLSLASALAARGWQVVFACSAETPHSCPRLERDGWRLAVLEQRDLLDPQALGAAAGPCDLLVVDHYGLDAAYERGCRPWARRILVLDDLADRRHDCDLLLDQTPGRRALAYRALVPPACRVLAGSRHALLRPQFAGLRAAVRARRAAAPARRLLVSFGLGDAGNATGTALEALALLDRDDLAVDLVLGPAAPHLAAVTAAAAGRPGLRLHVDPPDMARLMAAADLAIGAPGSSSLERACLGLPALLLVVADNQRLAARELAVRGAARVVGRHGEVTPPVLAEAIARLLDDPAVRARMAAAAGRLCDGKGAARLADHLTRLAGGVESRRNESLSLTKIQSH